MQDANTDRDLNHSEIKFIHNAWMNDVADWMSKACLQEYDALIDEANAADKGKKGKGRNHKGSAGKPGPGPRQHAQQLKKQRFNKVINDMACKKSLFMSFVRFPARLHNEDSIKSLLLDIQNVMDGAEDKKSVEISKKKSKELAELKYNRDQARKNLRRGRSDADQCVNSPLAAEFKAGSLLDKLKQLEADFGYRKTKGIAGLLQ